MNDIAIEAYKNHIEIYKDGEYFHTIQRDERDHYEDIPVIFYDMLPEIFEKLGMKVELCWDYKRMG